MRLILMTSTVVLALSGCGEQATEAGAGNDASAANTAVASIAGPDGRSEVRSGDAALSGLPEGIPPYPRAGPNGAVQIGGPSDGAEMRVMAFTTADPPADVIAFYADAARRAGFREIHRAESGPSQVVGFERDNGDGLNVTATAGGTNTRVQIMTGNARRRS